MATSDGSRETSSAAPLSLAADRAWNDYPRVIRQLALRQGSRESDFIRRIWREADGEKFFKKKKKKKKKKTLVYDPDSVPAIEGRLKKLTGVTARWFPTTTHLPPRHPHRNSAAASEDPAKQRGACADPGCYFLVRRLRPPAPR